MSPKETTSMLPIIGRRTFWCAPGDDGGTPLPGPGGSPGGGGSGGSSGGGSGQPSGPSTGVLVYQKIFQGGIAGLILTVEKGNAGIEAIIAGNNLDVAQEELDNAIKHGMSPEVIGM